MVETISFGVPATIGLGVGIYVLIRMAWKKKFLLKAKINGTKLLIVDRDLATVRLLVIVELMFFLASLTALILPFLPAIAEQAILWYLIGGSVFVAMTIVHIKRAQDRIERVIEREEAVQNVSIMDTSEIISAIEGADQQGVAEPEQEV